MAKHTIRLGVLAVNGDPACDAVIPVSRIVQARSMSIFGINAKLFLREPEEELLVSDHLSKIQGAMEAAAESTY
jgi:hypothetical protein